jgi:conjugative transfer signal peptidase TraF
MARHRTSTEDAPLLAWGEAMRATRARRRRLARRGALIVLGIATLAATIIAPPPILLVWNASASTPTGLYVVRPGRAVLSGDIVVARVPEHARALAAERRYLPANVPLVKHVAGVEGDVVCAFGSEITWNGKWLASRRFRDANGRTMPWWRGCVRLTDGQIFLLGDALGSFDGRYFGPTSRADIIGSATLLWRR